MRSHLSRIFLIIATFSVVLALVPWCSTPAQAQGKGKVIALGNASSPVLQGVAQGREKVDGRGKAREALANAQGANAEEKRRDAANRLKPELQNVAAILADLSEIEPTEEDRLIAQAALEHGIPIALEKVDGKKAAQMIGIGVDVDLLLVESRNNGTYNRLNIWDDGNAELQGKPEQTEKVTRDKSELDPNAEERQPEKGPKEKPTGPVTPPRPGFDKVSAEVEKILRDRPFSRGAQRQTPITNQCGSFSRSKPCQEWETYWSPYYFNPNGYTPSHVHDMQIEVGRYKLDSGTSAFVFRAAGSLTPSLAWDHNHDRGYFLEGWDIDFDVTQIPSGWKVDRAYPRNANKQGSVTSTTGWSVSPTAGVDMSGPSASLTASYSESNAVTRNLSEYEVLRRLTSPDVSWNYYLRSVEGHDYYQPTDLIKTGFGGADLRRLPNIARGGDDLYAEATWKGPRGTTYCGDWFTVVTRVKMRVHNMWIEDHWLWYNWYWRSYWLSRWATWSLCTNTWGN